MKIKVKKTKKQKGGSSNAVIVANQKQNNNLLIPATETDFIKSIGYLTENNLHHVKKLFEETFGKNEKISFNSYLKDPFIQGNHTSNFYHEWYKKINHEYKII